MTVLENNEFKTTHDAFHNSAFEVIQPEDKGYRSGLDALLIAAALPPTSKGLVADLGSGVGVAGLAALNLNRDLDAVLVEKNEKLVELAEQTIRLHANSFLRNRCTVLKADVTLAGEDRVRAGLKCDSIDHLIMNPPYNSVSDRPPIDPMRIEAFMMGEGGADAWFRTAAAITKPGGTFVTIYKTENLGDVIACTKGRFGGLEILPIHSRADEPAKRIVVRGTRASRAPMALLPGFVMHEKDGSYMPAAQEIVDGKSHLTFL